MNELATLKQSGILTASKDELSTMVSSYIKELAINGGEPMNDLALCRKYIYLLEELEKELKPYGINELNQYDKQEADLLGVTMKVVEAGVKNDFSSTTSWVAQKAIVDAENVKLKEIETLAKGTKGTLIVVDPETGETHNIYPPVKTSTTSIRITFK